MNEVINSKTFPQIATEDRDKLIEYMQKEKRCSAQELRKKEADGSKCKQL